METKPSSSKPIFSCAFPKCICDHILARSSSLPRSILPLRNNCWASARRHFISHSSRKLSRTAKHCSSRERPTNSNTSRKASPTKTTETEHDNCTRSHVRRRENTKTMSIVWERVLTANLSDNGPKKMCHIFLTFHLSCSYQSHASRLRLTAIRLQTCKCVCATIQVRNGQRAWRTSDS